MGRNNFVPTRSGRFTDAWHGVEHDSRFATSDSSRVLFFGAGLHICFLLGATVNLASQ